jgi:hypothetical protein
MNLRHARDIRGVAVLPPLPAMADTQEAYPLAARKPLAGS